MTKQRTFEKATKSRNYTEKVETMRAMLAESDEAAKRGDVELSSLLQASVTAMAHTVERGYGKGFYEVMGDIEGWKFDD